jgi:hypothetical protein
MITGFNTNIRHGGRLFHVQTEDSGRKHPHVISHLYYQGTILGSEKTSYEERVGSGDLEIAVRALMERQHKAMVARLKEGGFDEVIAARLEAGPPRGARPEPPASPPPPATASPQPPAPAVDERAFGEGIVSQKPLDEVILDYLVERARARPGGGPRRSHKKQ